MARCFVSSASRISPVGVKPRPVLAEAAAGKAEPVMAEAIPMMAEPVLAEAVPVMAAAAGRRAVLEPSRW